VTCTLQIWFRLGIGLGLDSRDDFGVVKHIELFLKTYSILSFIEWNNGMESLKSLENKVTFLKISLLKGKNRFVLIKLPMALFTYCIIRYFSHFKTYPGLANLNLTTPQIVVSTPNPSPQTLVF
jgi:hypothetical protein